MKGNRINIFRGPSFEGFISALGIIGMVAGGMLIAFNYSVITGIIAILSGLTLFLNMKGTIIDLEKRTIKPYIYVLMFRIGNQFNLNNYNKIGINTHRESIKMNSRGTSGDYQTKEFEVSLMSQESENIILKSFLKKDQAEKFMSEIEDLLK